MASIPVMNPPRRKRHSSHRHKRRKKNPVHHFKRAKRVKKRRVHRRKKAKLLPLKNTHRRKRHHKKSHRRHHRRSKRHSSRKGLINPFSEIALIGNPRQRGHSSRRRKHTMAKHRRHHRRHRSLMNPFSASGLLSKPKEMFSKDFLTESVSAAGGFILPDLVMGYLPVNFRDTALKHYAAKVMSVAVVSTAASMVSKKIGRYVLIGGGISILMDLWTQFRAQAKPVAAGTPGTSAYFGSPMGPASISGMDAYYGLGDEEAAF